MLPAPVGQRHIVLLRPVVPRSMPPEVIEEMKSRFVRDFRVPLNETLRAVVYAGDDGVQQAMKIAPSMPMSSVLTFAIIARPVPGPAAWL